MCKMRRVGQIASSDTTSFKFGVACSILTKKLNSSGQRTFLRMEEGGVMLGWWFVRSREIWLTDPFNKTPSFE